jgi:hypothetical protein
VTDPADPSLETILAALRERAKELQCLYRVDEALGRTESPMQEVLDELVGVIPEGWQYPDVCRVRIRVDQRSAQSPDWHDTPWIQREPIEIDGESAGEIEVAYLEERPVAGEGPFLKEERRLIAAIADRLRVFAGQRRLRRAYRKVRSAVEAGDDDRRWPVVLEFLRDTDRDLMLRIVRRLINRLRWDGVEEAEALLQELTPDPDRDAPSDENQPLTRLRLGFTDAFADRAFRLATEHLNEDEVLRLVRAWIKEDRASFLFEALESQGTPLAEIVDAVQRYRALHVRTSDLPPSARTGLQVALLRRVLSDNAAFVRNARREVQVEDFFELAPRILATPRGHGKLGGKSSGLFVAERIVRRTAHVDAALEGVRVPRTWYVASDGLLEFIRSNDLEDVYHRKYADLEQIRIDYPRLVQLFKNSPFPPDLSKGLALALDELDGRPIIVRSSSLLEDREGSAFSGKYKSLFLANLGSKRERLEALQDAVAEIYASVFGPDPLEYRAERGLLDVHEEMGLMIQEVVGTRVGPYFLPTWSGVAMSLNEFRWSPRIRRDDGLVRLVPGLGTRAVDRTADDYPVLVTPGQPRLSVNVTPDEIDRYSPHQVDVINLESRRFETIDLDHLLAEHANDVPGLRRVVSFLDGGAPRKPSGLALDVAGRRTVATFQGLLEDTPFVPRIRAMLRVLEERLGSPVDIEFASDGEHFYLLQCRPQSDQFQSPPASIPRDVPHDRILFTANRYVSNGRIPDLTHVVYVDPDAYARIEDPAQLREVGRVVGKINGLLPRRRFLLMGPGRWGSRGDLRLGVPVTYADIRNTALLVEVAKARGRYVPDLSFGTHFFQDLVEADIRYLPLYPEDEDVDFNESFFARATNRLAELLPEHAHLADVIRIIDVPQNAHGRVLRVLLNAELDEAMGLLVPREESGGEPARVCTRPAALNAEPGDGGGDAEEHWRWRMRMAEAIGAAIDPGRFGVRALYVLGSTKNGTAGAGSDLDLLIHVAGDDRTRATLTAWLDGWSRALAEVNFLRTGTRVDGLLDVRTVTDDDIASGRGPAARIGAATDAARPVPLKRVRGA